MNRRIWLTVWLVGAVALAACAQNRYTRPTAERYYDDAQKALLKKDCWMAQKMYRNLLSDFPGSHLVDDAQYGLGMASFCSKDYVTAAFEFERLLNEFPTSPWVDEARYQIGMCYYTSSPDIHHDQEDTRKAIREFRRFLEDFPGSHLAKDTQDRIEELKRKLAEKQLMIAENYFRWGNYLSSVRYCEIILDQQPYADLIRNAWFVMAQSKARMGEYEEAMSILTRLASEDGASRDLREQIIEATTELQEEMKKQPRPPEAPSEPSSNQQAFRPQ
jgi:outer membrane protein assembly factor BamD